VRTLLPLSVAHHGKPVDDNRIVTEQASYASNYFQHEDPSHPVGKQWREAQEMIFHKALQSGGFNQVEDLPEIPSTGTGDFGWAGNHGGLDCQ